MPRILIISRQITAACLCLSEFHPARLFSDVLHWQRAEQYQFHIAAVAIIGKDEVNVQIVRNMSASKQCRSITNCYGIVYFDKRPNFNKRRNALHSFHKNRAVRPPPSCATRGQIFIRCPITWQHFF